MKGKIGKYLSELRFGFVRVVRRYPVETALQTVLAVLFVWWAETEKLPFPAEGLWLFPLFSLGALVINTLAGASAWRRVYYVCWAPLVPLLCWSGLKEWIASEQFAITIGLLVPLALVLCRRARNNQRFAADVMLYVRSAFLALFFTNVALALFQATFWSAAYIFGFDDVRWISHFAGDVAWCANLLIVPVVFLMLLDRWENAEYRLARFGEVLVNWLFTPALIVYALLLHLYALKIVLVWSLPRGGVAYLVFGFMLMALLVRLLRELIDKHVAEWFYSRFSFFMLVPALLFWVGVMRRVSEYGLTDSRVYLLVCGIVMTLAVGLFFLRSGRYSWLCASAFVLFAAMAYVPFLSPKNIGLHSQRARFERLGHELGMLDDEGRFVRRTVLWADSVRRADYADFFSAMRYVELRDTTFRTSLDLGDKSSWGLQYELLPWEGSDTVIVEAGDIVEVELPLDCRIPQDATYRYIYPNLNHGWISHKQAGVRFKSDTLRIVYFGKSLLTISGDELVRRQMKRTGLTFEELSELKREQATKFLDYRDERVRVIFSSLKVERRDSTSYGCAGAAVELVMSR
ncbi:MAG: DUF4153 domain-containing protein [Alistipes senegalensis]|nr:DUF4153 domain-containing protein [Bacteroides cellulosilyticus]MCM1352333.1 DUF4153 domain-containing protein [Alistipes senegalensis]